jgi:thymidylate kinase
MKLIIFEGLDRCGKDTYIRTLTESLRNYSLRHWSFPQGEDNEAKTKWQRASFHEELSHYVYLRSRFPSHTLFWNRSHLGELVYGSIYRDSQPDTWVLQLESLYGIDRDPDVYLVHLTADADFLLANDDGNSYSTKLEKKEEEISKFAFAVENSKIKNKLTIKINDGSDYRNIEQITAEISRFVGI